MCYSRKSLFELKAIYLICSVAVEENNERPVSISSLVGAC